MNEFANPKIMAALEAQIPPVTNPTKPEHLEWCSIVPFDIGLPAVHPFDPTLLPENISPWLSDICERMDSASLDFAAVAVMVSLGSLIGRKAYVYPKQQGDWYLAANLWGVMIGRPSTKKTPLLSEILSPLHKFERDSKQQYESDVKQYESAKILNEIQLKETKDVAKKLIKDGKPQEAHDCIVNLTVAVEDPTRKRYILNDTTTPKLGELLGHNPQGLLLARDELTGWLRSMDREDRGEDRAFFLECWNGTGRFTYDRIGRGTIDIEHACLSVIGGIQPAKLTPYLLAQKQGSGDDGLIERLQLAVYPDSPVFKFVDRARDNHARNEAFSVFQKLNELPLAEDDEIPGIRFDSEAQLIFNEWYTNLHGRFTCDLPSNIESHLAKYPSLFAKIALIIHLSESDVDTSIAKRSALKAKAWCHYLESHALRIYSLANDADYSAKALLGKLSNLSETFTVSDFANKGWSGLKSKEEIAQALAELERRNFIQSASIPTNGRTRIQYFINPAHKI